MKDRFSLNCQSKWSRLVTRRIDRDYRVVSINLKPNNVYLKVFL